MLPPHYIGHAPVLYKFKFWALLESVALRPVGELRLTPMSKRLSLGLPSPPPFLQGLGASTQALKGSVIARRASPTLDEPTLGYVS